MTGLSAFVSHTPGYSVAGRPAVMLKGCWECARLSPRYRAGMGSSRQKIRSNPMSLINHSSDFWPVTINQDYLDLCEGSICGAAILELAEAFTEFANEDSETHFWATPEWLTGMFGGLFRIAEVRRMLNRLVRDGWIDQTEMDGGADYYALNAEAVQAVLNALELDLEGGAE
jgi:hypothetical protein